MNVFVFLITGIMIAIMRTENRRYKHAGSMGQSAFPVLNSHEQKDRIRCSSVWRMEGSFALDKTS